MDLYRLLHLFKGAVDKESGCSQVVRLPHRFDNSHVEQSAFFFFFDKKAIGNIFLATFIV